MPKSQSIKKNLLRASPKKIVGFCVSALIFVLMFVAVYHLSRKYFTTRTTVDELQSEQVALQQKEQDLMQNNAYLATPEGTEHLLRDKYQLVQPGEGMIVITDPDDTTQPPPKESMLGSFWDSLMKGLGFRH